jgi:hypothetical protein
MKLYEKVYDWMRLMFWVLYVVAFLGLLGNGMGLERIMDDIFKIFVGTLLIYIFNPWNKQPITQHHKKIVFEAGIMLLLSTSVKSILQKIPVIKQVVV